MKRPLLPVALLYVSGILAAELVPLPLPLALGLSLCLAAVTLVWTRLRGWLLCPLVVLGGAANCTFHSAIVSPFDLRSLFGEQAQLVTIRGNVMETPALREYQVGAKPSWKTLARVEVRASCPAKGAWGPACGAIVVATPGMLTNVFGGQLVEVTGVAARPKRAVAEGTFDYRQYLLRQGIHYELQAESERDWRMLDGSPAPPLADRFRGWARRALALGLPVEDEALRLEWALALGWKTALTDEASEPFVRAGTYHIFAVDGLRMAIVFGIFYGVLRATGLPRALSGLVLLPLVWFYVGLTGWPASAIRASVMLTVIIAGWVVNRPSDPMNSLLAAALIILTWEPQQLFQAGFQLSFFVVLFLILAIPPLFKIVERITAPDPLLPRQLQRRWHPAVGVPARYVADLALTSFAAWAGSIPLVAYYFNILTPVSTLANILAVPLCVLVLISNFISLLTATWLPAAAGLFNQAGWFLMECIRVTGIWFAKWPAASCNTPAPGLVTIAVYYVLLLAVASGWVFRPAGRVWRLSATGGIAAAWIFLECLQWQATKLTVLPVNGGTSIYCDALGTSHDLLIDVGSTNSVRLITQPFLRAQGLNRSPPLFLTHGDLHHVGGVEPFRQEFNVARIYTSPMRFRSPVYRRILARLEQTPGLIRTVNRGDIICDWAVLHPSRGDRFTRADDGAIVMRGLVRGTRVLLLSDLGGAGQKALAERTPDLSADIVVTGLPAADEPLSGALIAAIRPRLIIVSDSEFPISERASPKLCARLQRTGLPVVYTRATGAVTLEFRDNSWRLRTVNGLRLSSGQANLTSAIEDFRRAALASGAVKSPGIGVGTPDGDKESESMAGDDEASEAPVDEP